MRPNIYAAQSVSAARDSGRGVVGRPRTCRGLRAVAGKIKPSVRGTRAYARSSARSKYVRPQFGSLLMRTTLMPALEDNADRIVRDLDEALERVFRRHGFH